MTGGHAPASKAEGWLRPLALGLLIAVVSSIVLSVGGAYVAVQVGAAERTALRSRIGEVADGQRERARERAQEDRDDARESAKLSNTLGRIDSKLEAISGRLQAIDDRIDRLDRGVRRPRR